jgi:hypothetical protein
VSASERYVPAAGRRAFTRLYDPVVALTMREATFRGRLCALLADAGLSAVALHARPRTGWGSLELLWARRL